MNNEIVSVILLLAFGVFIYQYSKVSNKFLKIINFKIISS